VAAAKVVVDFAKSNEKLVILGAGLGTNLLNAEGVKALATLPSLDELRGKLLGMLQTPATRIAGVLQAPGGQIARVIAAYAKQDEAA
jgi:large subunit ribosomal protein L10